MCKSHLQQYWYSNRDLDQDISPNWFQPRGLRWTAHARLTQAPWFRNTPGGRVGKRKFTTVDTIVSNRWSTSTTQPEWNTMGSVKRTVHRRVFKTLKFWKQKCFQTLEIEIMSGGLKWMIKSGLLKNWVRKRPRRLPSIMTHLVSFDFDRPSRSEDIQK